MIPIFTFWRVKSEMTQKSSMQKHGEGKLDDLHPICTPICSLKGEKIWIQIWTDMAARIERFKDWKVKGMLVYALKKQQGFK